MKTRLTKAQREAKLLSWIYAGSSGAYFAAPGMQAEHMALKRKGWIERVGERRHNQWQLTDAGRAALKGEK